MVRRRWYYQKSDGKRHGPYSSRKMKQLARQGHLEPRDRVWKAGSPSTFLAADFPQLYLRTATHRTWLHVLKTLAWMAACLLAAAVTSPWSNLSVALPAAARPWLTGFSIASLAAAILAGGIGFLRLDATYMMVPSQSSRSRKPPPPSRRAQARGMTR
jgi:hypothetical protein